VTKEGYNWFKYRDTNKKFNFSVSRRDGLSSFEASIKNKDSEVEIITRGFLGSNQQSIVKIWPDTKQAILTINGVQTKIESEADLEHMSKDARRALIHSIVIFQEATSKLLEEPLYEKKKQFCGTIEY
jgi:hypothetical protein